MGLMLLCQQPPYLRERPIPTCIELYGYEKVDADILYKTFPCEGAKKIATPSRDWKTKT